MVGEESQPVSAGGQRDGLACSLEAGYSDPPDLDCISSSAFVCLAQPFLGQGDRLRRDGCTRMGNDVNGTDRASSSDPDAIRRWRRPFSRFSAIREPGTERRDARPHK